MVIGYKCAFKQIVSTWNKDAFLQNLHQQAEPS